MCRIGHKGGTVWADTQERQLVGQGCGLAKRHLNRKQSQRHCGEGVGKRLHSVHGFSVIGGKGNISLGKLRKAPLHHVC